MKEERKGRWQTVRDWRWKADRPYRLIVFALLPLVVVAILERLLARQDVHWLKTWIEQSGIFGPLLFPNEFPSDQPIKWADRVTSLLYLLGLPVLFCLWYWRDRNTRDQIENARKDINLKEFQEVQLRAAGALDESLPAEAREQLQIAALHQLRGFLRGEFGESFRRPAFELLLAGHAEAMDRIGLSGILAQIRAVPVDILVESRESLAITSSKIDRVMGERMNIISDEWRAVFLSGFPLKGRSFDFLLLGHIDVGRSVLDLAHSSFVGARLDGAQIMGLGLESANLHGASLMSANLAGANLARAHLRDTTLSGANLEKADLSNSNLNGATLPEASLREASLNGCWLVNSYLQGINLTKADLTSTRFYNADLRGADFHGALMRYAHFHGADLRYADLGSTSLTDVGFDLQTKLEPNWDELSPDDQSNARDGFCSRGAVLFERML